MYEWSRKQQYYLKKYLSKLNLLQKRDTVKHSESLKELISLLPTNLHKMLRRREKFMKKLSFYSLKSKGEVVIILIDNSKLFVVPLHSFLYPQVNSVCLRH